MLRPVIINVVVLTDWIANLGAGSHANSTTVRAEIDLAAIVQDKTCTIAGSGGGSPKKRSNDFACMMFSASDVMIGGVLLAGGRCDPKSEEA
jgi:hypothetical protein